MSKDYCVIAKLTDNCNLRCNYCYHFQHNSHQRPIYSEMPIDVIDSLMEALVKHNSNYAHFIWHGGEPLIRGLDLFKHIVRRQGEIQKVNHKNIQISNCVQTNGTLLTNEFIDFFVENDFQIGISLDGDENTQMKSRGFSHLMFNRLMESISYLNSVNARYGVLCVVGKETSINARNLFTFYVHNNINHIGFLPMVITNRTGFDKTASISSQDYGRFLCDFFDIWVNSGITGISIREFDDFIRFRCGHYRRMCTNCGDCDMYYTVAPNGNIYPCDCFASCKENELGNVSDGFNLFEESSFVRNLNFRAHKTPLSCMSCEYIEMCNGGCAYYRHLVDKNLEHPSYYCTAFKMLYKHIDRYVEVSKNE